MKKQGSEPSHFSLSAVALRNGLGKRKVIKFESRMKMWRAHVEIFKLKDIFQTNGYLLATQAQPSIITFLQTYSKAINSASIGHQPAYLTASGTSILHILHHFTALPQLCYLLSHVVEVIHGHSTYYLVSTYLSLSTFPTTLGLSRRRARLQQT